MSSDDAPDLVPVEEVIATVDLGEYKEYKKVLDDAPEAATGDTEPSVAQPHTVPEPLRVVPAPEVQTVGDVTARDVAIWRAKYGDDLVAVRDVESTPELRERYAKQNTYVYVARGLAQGLARNDVSVEETPALIGLYHNNVNGAPLLEYDPERSLVTVPEKSLVTPAIAAELRAKFGMADSELNAMTTNIAALRDTSPEAVAKKIKAELAALNKAEPDLDATDREARATAIVERLSATSRPDWCIAINIFKPKQKGVDRVHQVWDSLSGVTIYALGMHMAPGMATGRIATIVETATAAIGECIRRDKPEKAKKCTFVRCAWFSDAPHGIVYFYASLDSPAGYEDPKSKEELALAAAVADMHLKDPKETDGPTSSDTGATASQVAALARQYAAKESVAPPPGFENVQPSTIQHVADLQLNGPHESVAPPTDLS